MDFNLDPWNELAEVAVDSVAEGSLPREGVLPGVRALDLWSQGTYGAMLFWVDAESTQNAEGAPELHDVIVTRADGPWRSMGSASATQEPWDDLLASVPLGLSRCGRSSAGAVRVTWATASPEVDVVRLRDHAGSVRDRRPGRHGFVLLGITPEDPTTYAHGIGHAGEELPGEPILL